MKHPPERAGRQPSAADANMTVAALVQMLADAGLQPHKIKASLTKSAKPGSLVALEKYLGALPSARRA